jgi:hypothetical protein
MIGLGLQKTEQINYKEVAIIEQIVLAVSKL